MFCSQTDNRHGFGKINEQFVIDRHDKDVWFPLALVAVI